MQRLASRLAVTLLLAASTLCAQQTPDASTPSDRPPMPDRGPGGGRGMRGNGLFGQVTETAADHLTLKVADGSAYTVHFGEKTRFARMKAQPPRSGEDGQPQRMGPGGTPPESIQLKEIHSGDSVTVMGERDDAKKSVNAFLVMLLDPEAAKRMQERAASFGVTWLAGRVTAVNDLTVTLEGESDHKPHTFTVDENTAFRERREPAAFDAVRPGTIVNVEGAVKSGSFLATTVSVLGARSGQPRPGGVAPDEKQDAGKPQQ